MTEKLFIDYAKIMIEAGKGGDGCSSFHREKFVPKGGPDGGNGGRGGNIIFVSDKKIKTLIDFKYKRKFKAQNGSNGMKSNKTGASGEDLIIKVPVGVVIKNAETGEVLADLVTDNALFITACGGRGGRGNAMFKSSTNRSPDYCERGEIGEKLEVILELKLLADIAIIGLPNAGKSTLLSIISAARPKIADYPFTTLVPNLGVVKIDDELALTFADIPGLIENAHNGAGLGTRFLRHIERANFFVHLIDANSDNVIKDFDVIYNELKLYNEKLLKKKQIVVLNKIDCIIEKDLTAKKKSLKKYCAKYDNIVDVLAISAAAKINISELLFRIKDEYLKLEKENVKIEDTIIKEYKFEEEEPIKVKKLGDGFFEITGTQILKAINRININTDDGLTKFNRILEKYNINYLLKKLGAVNGDIVYIGEQQFDYYDAEQI
ncbi:MAG TPA: GTPase ObgE [bacterium]|nr:GTPase ObgE [bacterium]